MSSTFNTSYFLLCLIFFGLLVSEVSACFGLGCGFRFCNARARGSRTEKFLHRPVDESVQSSEVLKPIYATPDDEFSQCCADRGLPQACMNKCNYKTYSAAALQSMFFRLDECPIDAASAIHFCASRNKNHENCCQRNGVTQNAAGDRCMIFCREEPPSTIQLDMSYAPCLERFDRIKQCFWNDIATEYRRRTHPAVSGMNPSERLVLLKPLAPSQSYGEGY